MQFRVFIAVTSVAGMPINQQSSTQSPITEHNDVVYYELDKTEETFFIADKDGDDKISKEEFKTFHGEELPGLFYVYDIDDSGTIDFFEFFHMVEFLRLEEFFDFMDRDGNGLISFAEFKHALTPIGEQETDEEIKEELRDADIDGDGQLNFEELVARMELFGF